MAKIICPNGCDPEDLEHEDFGGYKELGRGAYVPPSRCYRCNACDWSAEWTLGERGIDVRFDGADHRLALPAPELGIVMDEVRGGRKAVWFYPVGDEPGER